ncbi:MAG: Sua5/YciO/YrdC/YwlC family protein [Sulfurimonas sp.]|nr:Sua5/YciO/YrdC/YwlC family protein [Sulfurimonas sp.]
MPIILTQTDTTVGFLSQDAQKLCDIKSRPSSKPFIRVYKDFKSFINDGKRVPKKRKKLIRRSKKTTFIIGDFSFRIAKVPLHSQFLRDTPWFYSTSANRSGEHFERAFCEAKADIIIEESERLREKSASKVIKINAKKWRRLR